jgi:membrane fusion protein, multidrug efflux system
MSMVKSVLVFAAGFAAAALVAFYLFKGFEPGKAAGGAPPPGAGAALEVPVASVVKKTVPVYLDYVGTTDAIRSVTLQAQVIGYLLKRVVADGADVHEGELLYRIDPRNYQAALDQAKATEAKDTAALEYAQANHRRNASMSKTGDVSIDALQQSESTEHQDNATLAADRAAIETAQINLGYTEIRAPFAGRLSLSLVNEGAVISVAGTQLNTLVQLDPIYATFNPPDSDLPEIQKYQAKGAIPAEIIVGDATTPQYRGKLTFLDNNVGRSTGSITARATIDNPSHTLLPGQFIRVRLHVADQSDALLVPQVAVGSSQLGSYVYVVGQGGKLDQRYVTLASDYDPLVVVSKGVAEGESVVVGNLLKIGPGMTVKPVPEKQAPPAGPSQGGAK